jgi:polysaccharide export outer membrane protein
VPAQGLTLGELKREIDERYAVIVDGIEVTPILLERAPRYIFVVGEVRTPGRFVLEGPTTVMQAIALAGGWNVGANLRQVVVFRRTEDWRLIATKLRIQRPLLGKAPCPADEIWLRDSDLVVVPKSSILQANDLIELIFTRGIYGVLPIGYAWDLTPSTL